MPVAVILPQTQIIYADLEHELGNDAKARELYEDLLNQWEDPDPDFPFLKQVRDGLAKFGK